ncbi:saccharopine dehydrogenase family protein [Herbiconiux flava]|uniref:Saccharopine dehydrogenase-like NADP-dependent oxidoreductase n=1 Tax=Herbiconiux flava TaxID=881268 RepID=A0A852S9T2_9MICO|nr:saccharopine dehydrogenase C-terminal domain-containing protein [Herbiconiux flava]NYD68996.1 saccharopine dehydrogenase-like NADP-dependent oxidoreductase [Herbiconiux flava]GLK15744.1 ATP-binding protein [Herbiconiux flava]
MRILLVGAGGVGDAIAKIAARRSFYDHIVVTDYDLARAERTVAWVEGKHGPDVAARFTADRIDASNPDDVAEVARRHGATHVMNAVEPKFVPTIFAGALAAGADYLDMAMSLSEPHPTNPYTETGVKLGDDQFAQAPDWEKAGRLALVGMGVEPGLSDVFARYAADHLFSEIDELGTRDGANLVVRDSDGNEIFAPSFSIWTTIEECLNPPVIWEKDTGWFTTPPFSEPEVFTFPEGIGDVECVNVEHEEVLLMPRWVDAKRVTFKYGLGEEFIGILKTLHQLGLDKTQPVRVRSANGPVEVAPRDVVAAGLPDPATLGPFMTGKTCAGLWVTGTGTDGEPREVYLYHVSDNEWTMAEYEAQCVVWQTALNPVIALELLARGTWTGTGVLGPEAFDAKAFLDLMAAPLDEGGYGQAWGLEDRLA